MSLNIYNPEKKIFEQKESFIFLLFILVSITLRFFSFFPSMLGHDESTYMIIGRDILNGKLLYTDVTDTKPVGIFLFYAGLEYLFGGSIFMKRLMFSVLVGITSFFLLRVSNKLFKNRKIAFATGIVYILYTSIWNYHGRSPNTELLFNFFTILGLFLFLKPGTKTYFLGGLALGAGFMVKYLVLMDLFAFLLYFFILDMKNLKPNKFWSVFSRYVLAGFAFALPFALTHLYFWLGDNFHSFYAITYELPGKYGSTRSITKLSLMILELIGKFLPISYLIIYTMVNRKNAPENKYKWFFLLWIVSIVFALYLPGKGFAHYTIQLMLPLSLLAGLFFHPNFVKDRITATLFSGKVGVLLMILLISTLQVLSIKDDYLKTDYSLEVAKHIEEQLEPGDKVFVSNYEQIVYYLLEMDSPTKFVHASLLFSDLHKGHVDNPKEEVQRILNTYPKFVLVQRKNEFVQNFIKDDYQLDATFRNDEILVYKRLIN